MQSNNDKWYVAFEGRSYGPYPFETLRVEAAAGRMPRETFVWAPGMEGWKAAGEVKGLFETQPPPPSSSPAAQVMVPQLNSGKLLGSDDLAREQESTKKPDLQLAGAWRRFFARSIDLWLTTFVSVFLGAIVLGLTSPAWSIWMQDPTSAGIFAWMMVPIAMVADAAVVAVFGNSLGKGLLGVRVRSMDGKALRFSAYMQRNFKVWTYGFGLCIPLISLLTMGSQAQALKKRTATGYDSGLYEVKALPLGPVRAIAAATVIVLLFALVAYLNVQEQADRRNFATGHDWTNPVTRAVVQVPPGWVSTLQTNDQGQSIYMFTYPRENLAVVFGNESLSRGMTGAAYAQAFPFAVKDAMALGAATEAGPVNGRESWTTTGYIVADSKQSVVVTIVQSGNQMWRTVAIRLNGMPPDTDSYRRLQDRLFASIR